MKKSLLKRLFGRSRDVIDHSVYQDFEFRHLADEFGGIAKKKSDQGIPAKLVMAQALLEIEEVNISIEAKYRYWSVDKQKDIDRTLEEVNYLKANVEAFIESELKAVPDSMLEDIDKAESLLSELKSKAKEVNDLHTNSKIDGHEK